MQIVQAKKSSPLRAALILYFTEMKCTHYREEQAPPLQVYLCRVHLCRVYAVSFSTAARRAQIQKTSIALSRSSRLGKEGAMRMLLSYGSLPKG